MLKKTALFCLSLALLVGLSTSLFAQPRPGEEGRRSAAEKIEMLASRPVLDVLEARHISSEERTTVYSYADRVEYYDNALAKEILAYGKLPATAEDGVLYTEIFFTQFRKHAGLYVVQRGWDQNGNCRVLTTGIRTKVKPGGPASGIDYKQAEIEVDPEGGNSCSGDPCSKCKPYDRDLGCQCEIGTRCNHTVTTP